MKDKMIKIWTRNYNLNFMATLAWALNSEPKRFLKTTFPSTLGQGVSGKTSFWMGEEDKRKFSQTVTRLFLKDLKSFKRFLDFYKRSEENFKKAGRKISSSNLEAVSGSSLIKFYKDFYRADTEFMLIGQYAAFDMIEIIPEILREKLIKEKIDSGQIDKIMATVLSPFRIKAIEKLEKELTKLAYGLRTKKISKDRKEQIIKKLIKEYNWLPSIVVNASLWGEEFFRNRLREIRRDPNLERMFKELREAGKIRKNKKRDFKSLLIKYPRLKEFFQIANQLTDLKDSRDEVRRFAYFLARPLFYKISSRAKLEIDKILLLTPLEILNLLQKGILPSRKEMARRKKDFIVCVANRKFKIYSGQQAVDFSRKYLKEEEEFKQERFSGIIASGGKARGRVKIVLDKRDLPKVKQGEILVAVTTHPDYLLAMKKARAIVTDEGGLTSHAAIVSRELGVPCIVGTKIATQVLRDGQLIEVDANKGIVKILK